jgi:hypothetical protein
MFVKVVYSHIDADGTGKHLSLTNSPVSIEYVPGEWAAPVLPGSKLFVYRSLSDAVRMFRFSCVDSLPYRGLTFWEAQAVGVNNMMVIKDPPYPLMQKFWKKTKQGWTLWEDRYNDIFPWMYKFGSKPGYIWVADQVRLLHMLNMDDFEPISHMVHDLDR